MDFRVPALTGLDGRWGDLPGVAPEDLRNGGIFDARTFTAWSDQAAAGTPVSVTSRNRLVAALALSADLIALAPVPSEQMTAQFFSVVEGGQVALRLGAASFVDGDISAPIGVPPSGFVVRPAGAAATPPPAPAPTGTITITSAERRAQWERARGVLETLRLTPDALRYEPGAVADAGNPLALLAPFTTPGVIIIISGIAAYAAYSAYVNGRRITEAEVTQRIRIQEQAHTARAASQMAAQSAAYSLRLEEWKRTGRLPPPAPFEQQPVPVTPATPNGAQPTQPDWTQALVERTVTTLTWGAIALGGVGGALVLGKHFVSEWLERRATAASRLPSYPPPTSSTL